MWLLAAYECKLLRPTANEASAADTLRDRITPRAHYDHCLDRNATSVHGK